MPFPADWRTPAGSPAGVGFLPDTPAGKDGFLRVAGGPLARPDGRPPQGILDPARNDTQAIDAAALDRFDFFVAQLKRHGVYSDLNLTSACRGRGRPSSFDRLGAGQRHRPQPWSRWSGWKQFRCQPRELA